jgi:succinoglycan biosynthesis protein ExoA
MEMKDRVGGRRSKVPSVAIIIPARDAAATLPAALDSALRQDVEYPGDIEVIVADGSEDESVAELVRTKYPAVSLIENPGRILSTGVNLALRHTSCSVIVRCDAHTVLAPGYVRQAVDILQRTGAANVGGRQQPVGDTPFERCVAAALTSRLGAGDARYRVGGPAGPVDTVYLGVYRRDAFEAAGGYDPNIVRSQDSELNWRLRKRGETIWFDPSLVVSYFPRSTLLALSRQYFNNGRWKSRVLIKDPKGIRPRQLAPPLLVLSMGLSFAFIASGIFVTAVLPFGYMAGLVFGSIFVASRQRTNPLLLSVVLATMHIAWGTGFFLPARRRPSSASLSTSR